MNIFNLRRQAQAGPVLNMDMTGNMTSPDGNQFDPSQEIPPMDGGDQTAPMADDSSSSGGSGLHPGISSFVQSPQGATGGAAMIDMRTTHVATVTFKAKPGIKEHMIMNYVLKISEALGVEVEGFQWKKSEAKQTG